MPSPFSKLTKRLLWAATLIVTALGLWFASRQVIHKNELARWNPSRAEAEAQTDIHLGRMKIYLHGTIASHAIGVEPNQMSLIQSLPTEDAGIGCIVSDWDLRHLQGEYASRYNKEIVRYLQTKPR